LTKTVTHHEEHEGHEGFENYYISISYFALFATFVVKCLFRFWLRRSRARSFVVKFSFSVAARRNTFFVVKHLQIGASICHGFRARNLKPEHATLATVPGH